MVAGVYANIDSTRGVWKAPAGIEAGVTVIGVQAGPAAHGHLSGLKGVPRKTEARLKIMQRGVGGEQRAGT